MPRGSSVSHTREIGRASHGDAAGPVGETQRARAFTGEALQRLLGRQAKQVAGEIHLRRRRHGGAS